MKQPPRAAPKTGRHPIAVVAERTGLSQDVLRIWERRYAAVKPTRTPAGQRLYSDSDVEQLGLMAAATKAGRNVSHVALLSTAEIATLVDEDRRMRVPEPIPQASVLDEHDVLATALTVARALDGEALDTLLRRASATMGMPAFLESLAAPLLRRVGDEWHAGRLTPAQEHLVTAVLQGLITEAMRTFAPPNGAPKIVVATPAGDRHVIGAALAGAAAAVAGWHVVYLGADLPAAEIAAAARTTGARLVALSVIYAEDREHVMSEVRALKTRLPPGVTIIAGGAGAAHLAAQLTAIGVRIQSSIAGLAEELRRVEAA